MLEDQEEVTKDKCPDCGNTGIRLDEKTVTAVCECSFGKRRNRSTEDYGPWD